ncbi:hypothetical protein S83_028952, partial [Arachis hypogaea]
AFRILVSPSPPLCLALFHLFTFSHSLPLSLVITAPSPTPNSSSKENLAFSSSTYSCCRFHLIGYAFPHSFHCLHFLGQDRGFDIDLVNKVYILTQFNLASLSRHISRAYNSALKNYTCDYSRLRMLVFIISGSYCHSNSRGGRSKDIDDVLILSRDHLYRIDYMDFVQNHRESGADIILSCLPMDDNHASNFGLIKIDVKGRILSFSEKPKGEDLKAMQVDTTVLGLLKEEAVKKPYIASMGVYVFKEEILLNLLKWRFPTANDFGLEVISASAREFYMKAYLFNDYLEDIGTIRSFFEANLALTEH